MFSVAGLNPLLEQLLLKLILNTASTIIIGRLGYYEGNLMTSVYPSNSKLIDRTIRYVDFLLKTRINEKLPYEEIAQNMFKELYKLVPGESIVLKTVDQIIHHTLKKKSWEKDILKQASKPTGEYGEKMATRMLHSHAALVKWAIEQVLPEGMYEKRKIRVLDIGCGAGTGISILKTYLHNADFWGIDHSPEMVELTKEVNKELLLKNKLKVFHASVEKLPFEDSSFDLVIGVETFYFWPNKVKGLAEIKRVLKDKSIFCMINEAHKFEGLHRISGQMAKLERAGKIEINTPEEYIGYFKGAGFTDIEFGTNLSEAWIYVKGSVVK